MTNNNWILHDYLQVNGGAERLVLTVANRLPNFKLGISGIYRHYDQSAFLNIGDYEIFSNQFNFLPRIPRALIAFSQNRTELVKSKIVIYSGIYSPLAIHSQCEGKSFYYCHTLPRFAFDKEDYYLQSINPLVRKISKKIISTYKISFIKSIKSINKIFVNSSHTQANLQKYVGLDSTVIYPPIKTDYFKWKGQSNYYLSLGRLEPKKRIDKIILAFLNMPDKKLVITSGGSQYKYLKNLANNAQNIFFTNWVPDNTLFDLIGNAIACIYIPEDEDFGMSAVEAMSAGKPIITTNEGGTGETVVNYETGIVLPKNPSIDTLVTAINYISPEKALSMKNFCHDRSKIYSENSFISKLTEQLY
jgi:glycosyltransferase involved in cell wall biosynthesis